jgi:hypothetical protein
MVKHLVLMYVVLNAHFLWTRILEPQDLTHDQYSNVLLIKYVYLVGSEQRRDREREGMCKRDDLCDDTLS